MHQPYKVLFSKEKQVIQPISTVKDQYTIKGAEELLDLDWKDALSHDHCQKALEDAKSHPLYCDIVIGDASGFKMRINYN